MQPLPTVLPPPALPDGTVPTRTRERQANLERFQAELEFVQCLANPLYLHELHVQKYFEDPAFLEYLKYLEYWRKPEYVRFIVYPTCLVYLTLLKEKGFRDAMSDLGYVHTLIQKANRHHETWRAVPVAAAKEEPQLEKEKEVQVDVHSPDA
ncbi:hypothetical protein CspeluHIS016_0702040 [Cutaneotrichosporon spelunceum]|uniref:Mediator of RNA polymerase II transcription subunit 31 n=1 Tax=Cutaneotrichosporon spelunceum TaxID=1672016 RepID=A0AAD3TYI2_9TREE|nr:hypothetical protein CspeluHIS016_0702040 [Cutaneotrichosporon spelunceum]